MVGGCEGGVDVVAEFLSIITPVRPGGLTLDGGLMVQHKNPVHTGFILENDLAMEFTTNLTQ